MESYDIDLAPAMINELLDVIHNALFVIGSDNRIIFANTQTSIMFGRDRKMLMGLHLSELFLPDDADILVSNILTIIQRDKEIDCEAMFLRRDGNTFLGRISGTWFNWSEGNEGIVFSIHDISDMKSIENSFKQAEQAAFLGRLVNDISHQIINPIMAIGGFARRLHEEYEDSQHTQVILSEALRLEKFVHTLSRFSRLPRPKTERISFYQLVSELDLRIGARVRSKNCKWLCCCSEKLLDKEVLVDRERFFEAMQDITDNGCESYSLMPERKERLVCCDIEENGDVSHPYQISVIDFGIGISDCLRTHRV